MKSPLRLLNVALVIGAGLALWSFTGAPRDSRPAASAAAASQAKTEAPQAPATPKTDEAVANETTPPPQPPPALALPERIQKALVRIPEGRFKTELLALPEGPRLKALAQLSVKTFPVEDYQSLHVARDGSLYYACDLAQPASAALPHPEAASAAAVVSSGASVPITSPPVKHSRPGAPNVLFLDFGGMTITGTNWNSSNNQPTYVAKPYDTDNAPTTFSASEQAVIINVWERVSEDYAPFNVDVTTERPASFTSKTGHALITSNVDANGVDMPSKTSGGVAFINVFGGSNYATTFSPAFCYFNQVGTTSAANIAEVCSHELGHNMGLNHDGQTGGVEYYSGHGTGAASWAPIMGSAYGKNKSQWSKGEYYNANNTEDDLATIMGKLGSAPDEAGGTTATAASASTSGSAVTNAGVLGVAETDLYSVNTASGSLQFSIAPYVSSSSTAGGNADLKLELLDNTGAVVATADPQDTPAASLSYTAATGGVYYVKISSGATGTPLVSTPTGYTSYGSIGQYTLTGTIVASKPAITSATTATIGVGHAFTYQISGTNSPSSYSATGLPTGLSLNTSTGLISGNPTQIGTFTVTLGATNSLGSGSASLSLTVTDDVPAITTQSASVVIVTPGSPVSLSVTGFSANGTLTYAWLRNGVPVAGAASATLSLSSAAYSDSGYYQVVLTNTIGSATSAPFFVRVTPAVTEVVGWGDTTRHASSVKAGLGRAVKVSGGYDYGLVLLADGTVDAWGDGNWGQTSIPQGLSNVVDIAAGMFHCLALKSDGTVVAWGDNGTGESTVPSGLKDVVQVAAGNDSSYALKADGTVVAWGANSNGQTNVPGTVTAVSVLAAGYDHALVLNRDGTVVGWGNNANGQITIPGTLSAIRQVFAGSGYSAALSSTGVPTLWGNITKTPTPTCVRLGSGLYHLLGVKTDATLQGWGFSSAGEATPPAGLGQVSDVGGGYLLSFAIRDAGADTLPVISTPPAGAALVEGKPLSLSVAASGGTGWLRYQWRKGGVAISGATASTYSLVSASIADAGTYDVVITDSKGSTTSAGAVVTVSPLPSVLSRSSALQAFPRASTLTFTAQVTGTGTLSYKWYHNGLIVPSQTSNNYSVSNTTAADAGYYVLAATDTVGTRYVSYFALYTVQARTVSAWGDNTNHVLDVPSNVGEVVQITGGLGDSFALRADGTLVTWGANFWSMGNVPQAAQSDVVKVSTALYHVLALKSDGTVVAWGDNTYGQSNVPAGLSDVVDVAAGETYSVALRADGTLVAWGNNASGQLSVPSNSSRFVAMAPAANSGIALLDTGAVVRWGNSAPSVPAGATANVVSVAAGRSHFEAVKADGSLVSWGSSAATPPVAQTSVAAVRANLNHTVLLKSDETIYAWGTVPGTPTAAPSSLTHVFLVGNGYQANFAVRDDSRDPPVIDVQPLATVQTAGGAVNLSVSVSTPGVTYQWYKDGFAVVGATASSFNIPSASASDSGTYYVVVSRFGINTQSSSVTVTVNPVNPGGHARLSNMSIRAVAGENGVPLVVGFVMSGGAKDLLLRAAGPTLGLFGVQGTMADPKLDVHATVSSQDTILVSNDNWGSGGVASSMSQVFASAGAFAFSDAASLDAALVTNVDGVRTVHVNASGATGSGVVIVEAYDIGTGYDQRLVNVSARNRAGTGSETMIVGFTIEGDTSLQVLVRGVGPGLGAFGITGFMVDPKLELHRSVGATDTLLVTNDSWELMAGAASAFASAGAFGLPAGSKDAAIVATLAPGNYTCVLYGADGGTGDALIEVYEMR